MYGAPIRHRESTRLYLEDIKHKAGPLTAERERTLSTRIQQGDIQARNELVQANLRFVIDVAKDYQHHGLSLGELISAGNMGLVKAADRFDGGKGYKFITYAVWWIRQAILEALSQNRLVHLPINRQEMVRSIAAVSKEMTQRTGSEPSFTDIADEMDLPVLDIVDMMRSTHALTSLDEEFEGSQGLCLLDTLVDADQEAPDLDVEDESWRRQLLETLKFLDQRERHILCLYYGLDGNEAHTLEEIGAMINLTRERVRQIKERALNKLRHPSHLKKLYNLV